MPTTANMDAAIASHGAALKDVGGDLRMGDFMRLRESAQALVGSFKADLDANGGAQEALMDTPAYRTVQSLVHNYERAVADKKDDGAMNNSTTDDALRTLADMVANPGWGGAVVSKPPGMR